jgi:type II secretion system protein C
MPSPRFARAAWLAAALTWGPAPAAPQAEAPVGSSLILEGVVVSAVPSLSVALLRSPESRWARSVRVGESYLGMRLVEVGPTFVVLEREGERFELALKGEPASRQASKPALALGEAPSGPAPNAAQGANGQSSLPSESPARLLERDLDRAQAESRLQQELPLILAETRLTPRVNQGEVRGYRITHLPPGTLLSEVGLHPGDVLLSVDDLPVEKLSRLLGDKASYPELLSRGRIRLLVEREGETLELVTHLR